MNKLINSLLGIILLSNSNVLLADERDTLKVALFTVPREIVYWDENTGEVKGPLANLYRTIGVELGVKIQFVGPVPFRRMIAGLSNGAYQSSALLSKNPERERTMYFSEQALEYEHSYLVVAKRLHLGNSPTITTLQDLGPLLKSEGTERLIAPMDMNLPPIIRGNEDAINIWWLTLSPDDLNNVQSSRLIEAGRAGGRIVFNYGTAKTMTRDFSSLEIREMQDLDDIYIVFSKQSVSQSFVDKFNHAFPELALQYKQHQLEWAESIESLNE